jgi:nitrite reductase/ring-hydroxylating ferredoxin subunit
MAEAPAKLVGPDLSAGVPLDSLEEGRPLLGHAAGAAVLLCLLDGEPYAVGASCTHYGGPLAEGLVEGDTVRCPWHHACFSLRTGEALRPPALDEILRERVGAHVALLVKRRAARHCRDPPWLSIRQVGDGELVPPLLDRVVWNDGVRHDCAADLRHDDHPLGVEVPHTGDATPLLEQCLHASTRIYGVAHVSDRLALDGVRDQQEKGGEADQPGDQWGSCRRSGAARA